MKPSERPAAADATTPQIDIKKKPGRAFLHKLTGKFLAESGIKWFLVDQAVRASVHMTPEKFENAALFLRLRVPSTLFHHENGAFRKRLLNWRNFENTGFAFSCERKSGASRKR